MVALLSLGDRTHTFIVALSIEFHEVKQRQRERRESKRQLEGLQAQQGQKLQIYSSLQSEASQGIFFIFKRSDYFIAMFKTDRHNIFGGGREERKKKRITNCCLANLLYRIQFFFSSNSDHFLQKNLGMKSYRVKTEHCSF